MGRYPIALVALVFACGERGEPDTPAEDAAVSPLSDILPSGSAEPAANDPLLQGAGGDRGGDAQRHIGVVVARENVDVAARHAGEVAEVYVRIGDEVQAGEPVARLNEDSLREALAVTRAELAAARAELAQARVDVRESQERSERRQEFRDNIPQEELEAARFAVQRAQAARNRARADVQRHQAQVAEIERQLQDAGILAPLPGTIATRYVDPGALVEPGAPIVRLIASEGAWIRFAVPPEVAASLDVAMEVEAEIESFGETLPAIVRQIAPQIDPQSRLVLVEAELRLDDSSARVHAGLPVRVRVAPDPAAAPAD